MSDDGPLPGALRDAFRLERFGAPYAGGWMTWPARWLIPAETARGVYDAMTAVKRAMSSLQGDALEKWKADNAGAVKTALWAERLRDEDGDND